MWEPGGKARQTRRRFFLATDVAVLDLDLLGFRSSPTLWVDWVAMMPVASGSIPESPIAKCAA